MATEKTPKNIYLCTDNNGKNRLRGFNCTRIRPRKSANVIGAPVETGQMSFDNKVINPTEIVLEGIVVMTDTDNDPQNTISKIEEMLSNRKFQFYSITTDAQTYKNLILKECPSTNDRDTPDFVTYELTFVEALLVQNDKYTPANPNNTNTNARGRTATNPSSAGRGNMAIMR